MSGTTRNWAVIPTDQNWNTATNWSPSGVPAAIDPAIDNTGTAIISGGLTDAVANLDIGGVAAPGASAGHVIVGGSPDIGGGGGGTLTSAGTITVNSNDSGGGLVGGLASTITAPTMTIGANAIIGGGGTFNTGTILNSGLIQADGNFYGLGPLVLSGQTISGTGSIEIDGPSTLELAATTAQAIIVAPTATETPTLVLDNPMTFTGTLNLTTSSGHLDLLLPGTTDVGVSLDGPNHALTVKEAGATNPVPILSNGTVGPYMLTTGSGNDTLVGTGSGTLSGGAGTNTYVSNSDGSMMMVSTGTTDFVSAASGNNTVEAAGSGTGILGSGPGNLTVFLSGSQAIISTGTAAHAVIGIANTSSGDAVFGGSGTLNLAVGGAADTVAAGLSAQATIALTGTRDVLFGGSGILTGSVSGGQATIAAGAAQASVTASGSNDLVFGGTGTLNLLASGSGGTIAGGSGAATVHATSGEVMFGGSGSLDFVGSGGVSTVVAGAGAATMTGGAGGGEFVFFKAATTGLHDTITDFGGTDSLFLLGYDSTKSASALQNSATVGPSGVTLTLSDRTQITFSNLSNAHQLDGKILYG